MQKVLTTHANGANHRSEATRAADTRSKSVVQEHISILKEINAPAPLIAIAERVAATPPDRSKKY